MTTKRIDHTLCTHPRTPAGRAACRAQNNAWVAAITGAPEPTENTEARIRRAIEVLVESRQLDAIRRWSPLADATLPTVRRECRTLIRKRANDHRDTEHGRMWIGTEVQAFIASTSMRLRGVVTQFIEPTDSNGRHVAVIGTREGSRKVFVDSITSIIL